MHLFRLPKHERTKRVAASPATRPKFRRRAQRIAQTAVEDRFLHLRPGTRPDTRARARALATGRRRRAVAAEEMLEGREACEGLCCEGLCFEGGGGRARSGPGGGAGATAAHHGRREPEAVRPERTEAF